MKSDLIFYTNPMSRGQIVRWMLEESSADYSEQIIEYGEPMKSASYLAINPMGKVPAISHNGNVITECAAICAYIADAYPAAGLAPDPGERGDYYRWLFFAAGPLESAITNKSLGMSPDEEQQRMAGYGNYELVIEVLDSELSNKDYIANGCFTAADVYVGSQLDFGMQFGTIEESENFSAYVNRLRQRPAYMAAKKKDMDLMPDQST